MNDQELVSFWKEAFLIRYKIALEKGTSSDGTEFIAAVGATKAVRELKARMEKEDIFILKSKDDHIIGSPA